MGIDGAMVQMISHGLISGALFLCVGVMYDRVHSREIGAYGGVVNTMPKFAAFMVLFALANSGLPGTSGFVGEFLVILASFKANFWYAALAGLTLILGAAYTLWLVKRVIFGAVANHHVAELQDLNGREFIVLGVLAVAVLAVGLWPAPLLTSCRPPCSISSSRSRRASCHYDNEIRDMTWASLLPALPEIYLTAAICVLLWPTCSSATSAPASRPPVTLILLAGGAVLTAVLRQRADHRIVLFGDSYVADPLAVLLKLFAFLTIALALFYSREYLARRGMMRGEYYVLAFTALLGIFVLCSANSLLTVYVGVELMSLSLYAMVAFDRDSGIAAESAMKYFVLGAIASGMLLYGMSLIYGLSGTLKLDDLAAMATGEPSLGIILGLVFLVVARGVQVRRRAIPHVGARRVPRRADGRDAVPVHRAEDRVVRIRIPAAGGRHGSGRVIPGRTCSRRWLCCRWCSATWSPSRKAVSSACWRIRPSATSASSCSVSSPAPPRVTTPRCTTPWPMC